MNKKVIFIIIIICIAAVSVPIIYWIINIGSEDGGDGVENQTPVINSYYPLVDPSINETSTQKFNVSASDPDDDPLTYEWYLNGIEVGGNNTNYIFDANSNPYGTYTVIVNVTDGEKVANRSWTLRVQYIWNVKDCPGAPTNITPDQMIRLGIITDTERSLSEGSWNGAYMAVKEINEDGGVNIGGGTYYFGITSENSDEANPVFDNTTSIAAANKIIDYKKVQYAIGGYKTEAVLAYQPLFMEEQILFINTGAANPSLTQNVIDDYDTFKYFFHPSPQNYTILVEELIDLIIFSSLQLSLPKAYGGLGHNISRFSYIRGDSPWTAGFIGPIIEGLESNDYWNMTFTGVGLGVAQDITPLQMETVWDEIEDANTQIVIPLFLGPAGLTFTTSYAANQPHCLPYGINYFSQLSSFWTDTSGACNYSITLEYIFDTNKTELTLDFFNDYIAEYGVDPYYTAVGSYDAVYQLAWAIEDAGSSDPDDLVDSLESIPKSAPLMGAGGGFAYTASHCNYYDWPMGTNLAIQWIDGSKCLIPGLAVYPSDPWSTSFGVPPFGTLLNMTSLAIPHWGLYYFDAEY